MSDFTPVSGLIGGLIIGLAADVLLLMNGDVLGASGIVSTTVLSPVKALCDASQHWKLVHLASFLVVSSVFLGGMYDLPAAVEASRPLSLIGYALAGLFVGLGTKLGNGCTSGHGICGLPRLSLRSLTAVMTFMAFGVLSAILTSPTAAWAAGTNFLRSESPVSEKVRVLGFVVTLVFVIAALVAPFWHRKYTSNDRAKMGPAGLSGVLFAIGLLVSGMCYPAKVYGFLDITGIGNGSWDPTLILVMGGGLIVSFVGYQFLNDFRVFTNTKTLDHPVCLSSDCKFGVPTHQTIDKHLVLGSACFGIGWGIGGVCPGPAIFLGAIGSPGILMAWWPCFFLGSFIAQELKVDRSQSASSSEKVAEQADYTEIPELPVHQAHMPV